MRRARPLFIQAFQDAKAEHLALEVGALQLFAEDGFVDGPASRP